MDPGHHAAVFRLAVRPESDRQPVEDAPFLVAAGQPHDEEGVIDDGWRALLVRDRQRDAGRSAGRDDFRERRQLRAEAVVRRVRIEEAQRLFFQVEHPPGNPPLAGLRTWRVAVWGDLYPGRV